MAAQTSRLINDSLQRTVGPRPAPSLDQRHRLRYSGDTPSDIPALILLTTYNTTLTELLRSVLEDLGGTQLLAKVDIRNIDKVVRRVVKEAVGTRVPKILGDAEIVRLRDELAAEGTGAGFDGHWLASEWNQVVLAQHIRGRDEYFAAGRSGRGRRLNRPERAAVGDIADIT